MTRPLTVLLGERGSGRTTQAFKWVSKGVRTDGYPGWTRVLVVPTRQELDIYRGTWWKELEDFSHRVYFLEEWTDARHVNDNTEVCIDDLDRALYGGFHRVPGRLVAVTMWARPWETE